MHGVRARRDPSSRTEFTIVEFTHAAVPGTSIRNAQTTRIDFGEVIARIGDFEETSALQNAAAINQRLVDAYSCRLEEAKQGASADDARRAAVATA